MKEGNSREWKGVKKREGKERKKEVRERKKIRLEKGSKVRKRRYVRMAVKKEMEGKRR